MQALNVTPLVTEEHVINQAIDILQTRIKKCSEPLTNSNNVANFLKLKLAGKQHEVFCCLFLDNRHRAIEFVELFRGTINGCAIYPREVAKQALEHGAAAVILVHNHPSGQTDPSDADKRITGQLQDALSMLDIRVLDHFIIGGTDHLSFADRGLI